MSIIDTVAEKINKGIRLSASDALELYRSPDLLAIGRLADEVNRSKNGNQVFYNLNRHINPTNICVLDCKFCAYSRKPGDEGAYAYTIEEMVKKAGEAVAQGASEVHMVGGLHPRWKFSYYIDMLKAIKAAHPDLHIKAFTVVELNWLARKERRTIPEILTDLREAGLGSLPGGGAEIFHPEVREAICENKVDADMWLNTHKSAHEMGLQSNCTMLYGHIESYEHRVDHMRRLREMQDQSHGFNAFIPLSFQPENNDMGIKRYTFGYDDLKNIAIARLYLDNFQHIKAYWVMLGQEIAQLAVRFGANDLDGTVIEEKISRMAGGRSGMVMGKADLEVMIRKAGSEPVERDTLYNVRHPKRQGATSEAAFNDERLRSLLNKLQYTEALSAEDLTFVAEHAELHELGRLAHHYGDDQNTRATFSLDITPELAKGLTTGEVMHSIEAAVDHCQELQGMSPTSLCIDLGEFLEQERELANLIEILWAAKLRFSELEISLTGLKGLWRMAQEEDVSISDLLDRLHEAGIDCIESSYNETETDITHSEIVDIHQQIHQSDVRSIAKVELAAPLKGAGMPYWGSFIDRLAALSELHRETNGFKGISIEVSSSSFVTPAEYLRAVAIARLAAPQIGQIITPVRAIPALSPVSHSAHLPKQIPAQKYAPLCLLMGATDLGHIPYQEIDAKGLSEEIRAAGFDAAIRDSAFSRSLELAAPSHCPETLQKAQNLGI